IIHRVDKENKGLQIVLSRASNGFLKALFEAEVPEISEKVVEIVDMARDPGFRAKVLVRSSSPKVDPVGACVGMRGSRIRVIMNELSNEKIDLIPYIEDTLTMIAKSFSPATVSSVKVLSKEHKKAQVIVADDQLAMAIGRDGQNIRLASRLTGWDLEVKSEGQRSEETKRTNDLAMQDLLKIDGIGAKVAETLITMNVTDIRKLAGFTEEDLCSLEGIGEKTAGKIIAGAKKFLEENPSYGQQPVPEASKTEEVKNEPEETESK
ncbi:MAG TPA: helix-hairpin-helix domain-containing protein, partial [Elusimicrobiales bacterium]|nr:helix-hairpin-helix domain-containing protein [Elusimicrobiales bacterium]